MSASVRKLYDKYAVSVAYIAVETVDGTEGIGSAFHVGDGVFVTARHVVENNKILEISTVAKSYIPVGSEFSAATVTLVVGPNDTIPAHAIYPSSLKIIKGPFYHQEEKVDIAVFQVSGLDPYIPAIPLGGHLDDWLGTDDLVLSEVLVLGFPPIPFAKSPTLVAARGEVNGLIDVRHSPHVHFVVSAMARGGFSGGVVITSDDFVLGVVTQSLVMNNEPEQLGYMAVVSVEPIYQCLADHKMLPRVQSDGWDGLWNGRTMWFAKDLAQVRIRCSIDIFDDGTGLNLTVYNTNPSDLEKLLRCVRAGELIIAAELTSPDRVTFEFKITESSDEDLSSIEDALVFMIGELGYIDQNEYLIKKSSLPF